MAGYDLKRLRVLIVDDNKYMRKILRTVLEAMAITDIACVDNAIDAIEIVRERKPDLVIADWMMEPIDGIALTRALRNEQSSPDPFVPIFLITSHADKDLVLTARDAGVHEVLSKPVSIGGIYKRIVKLVEHPRPFIRTPDYFGPEPRRKGSEAA